MKEIIYLDTQLVNSLLAQTNKGLIKNLINEQSESDSKTESGTETKSTTGTIGVNLAVKAEGAHTETESDSYGVVFSKSNRNLIETALDDYSLDVLMDSLKNKFKQDDYSVGDLILISDVLESYNFKTLINGIELRSIGSVLDGYEEFKANRKKFDKLKSSERTINKNKILCDKVNNSPWNHFYHAKIMAEYMDSLFPNMTLIKIADTLSICDNNMIRLNQALLNFNNISERKAKVLGIVTSQFDEKIPANYSNIAETSALYRNAPSIFSNIILGSNNIISENEFIIRPISIYFES